MKDSEEVVITAMPEVSASRGILSRLGNGVKNLFSNDEKSNKKVEFLLTEKTDEVFSLLLGMELDRDKAEVLNRVRSRFEIYLAVKEADTRYYLDDLINSKHKLINPAPVTAKDIDLYKEKYENITSKSAPQSDSEDPYICKA